MKTIFDNATRDELILRINTLNENSTPLWGEMNIAQMLKHCSTWDEMAQGKRVLKRAFLGRIFGKMALKDFVKNNNPIPQKIPASPGLIINSNFTGDITEGKNSWINLLNKYSHYTNSGFTHPFFGKVTKEQAGYLAYKHADHHLRQFNS